MSEALDQLRRWEDAGALWRVVRRAGGDVDIALLTCDAGEEMGRIRTSEPDVLAHVDARTADDVM